MAASASRPLALRHPPPGAWRCMPGVPPYHCHSTTHLRRLSSGHRRCRSPTLTAQFRRGTGAAAGAVLRAGVAHGARRLPALHAVMHAANPRRRAHCIHVHARKCAGALASAHMQCAFACTHMQQGCPACRATLHAENSGVKCQQHTDLTCSDDSDNSNAHARAAGTRASAGAGGAGLPLVLPGNPVAPPPAASPSYASPRQLQLPRLPCVCMGHGWGNGAGAGGAKHHQWQHHMSPDADGLCRCMSMDVKALLADTLCGESPPADRYGAVLGPEEEGVPAGSGVTCSCMQR